MGINDTRDSPTASPCIGKCTLTTGDKQCKGCGRTEEEFRDWNSYTPEQKIAVKARCRERLKCGTTYSQ